MSLEDSINTLALAIEQLADAITREKREPAAITIVKADPPADPPNPLGQTEAVCMDTAGVPTTFKRRCGICGELGRYRSSHQEEMRNGTYHWVEVKI